MDSCGLWLGLCLSDPAWSPEAKQEKKKKKNQSHYEILFSEVSSSRFSIMQQKALYSLQQQGGGKEWVNFYLICLQGTGMNPVSLCFRNSRNKINEQTKSKTNRQRQRPESDSEWKEQGQVEMGKEVQLYGDG